MWFLRGKKSAKRDSGRSPPESVIFHFLKSAASIQMARFATGGWQIRKCSLYFLFLTVGLKYFTIKICLQKCLASIVCVAWRRDKEGEGTIFYFYPSQLPAPSPGPSSSWGLGQEKVREVLRAVETCSHEHYVSYAPRSVLSSVREPLGLAEGCLPRTKTTLPRPLCRGLGCGA